MSEKDKKIENEKLEEVSGGKSYWDGPVVRFSSEDGDWHEGDHFTWHSPDGPYTEKLVLTDNGVYVDNQTGHRYNAKRYRLSGEYRGDTQITDFDVMMRKNDLQFVQW